MSNARLIDLAGTTWGKVYSIVLSLETVFPPLFTVTDLLNLPTDVTKRHQLLKHCIHETMKTRAALREELLQKDEHIEGFIIDRLPIRLANIAFSLGDSIANIPHEMTFQQGQFVDIIGNRGEGKADQDEKDETF